MAFVARKALKVTVSWIDGSGSRSSSIIHLPAATALADVETKVASYIEKAQAVSGCAATSWTLAVSRVQTAALNPLPESRVEKKAAFYFRTSGAKIAKVTVPGILAEMVKPDGGIDSANANVAGFVNGLITNGASDSNGDDYVSVVADEEVYRATSKRQRTTDTAPVEPATGG